MTRKELITACIEDQIKRGIVKPENKKMQIKARLSGQFQMSLAQCQNWYNQVFNK